MAGMPGLGPFPLDRPLLVGLAYGGVCPEGAEGSRAVGLVEGFSASRFARLSSAKTTAS